MELERARIQLAERRLQQQKSRLRIMEVENEVRVIRENMNKLETIIAELEQKLAAMERGESAGGE